MNIGEGGEGGERCLLCRMCDLKRCLGKEDRF